MQRELHTKFPQLKDERVYSAAINSRFSVLSILYSFLKVVIETDI